MSRGRTGPRAEQVSAAYIRGIPLSLPNPRKRGETMRIERRYTKEGQSAYADMEFRLTASEIRNPDGSGVVKADDGEVPVFWSHVAAERLGQNDCPTAGLPAR